MIIYQVYFWEDQDEDQDTVNVYPFSTKEKAVECCKELGIHEEYSIAEEELDSVKRNLCPASA